MLRLAKHRALSKHTSRMYGLPALAGLLGLLLIAGCGGSKDPFSYVKVKGKVTYADGSLIPAQRIKLTFNSELPPLDAKTYPSPALPKSMLPMARSIPRRVISRAMVCVPASTRCRSKRSTRTSTRSHSCRQDTAIRN